MLHPLGYSLDEANGMVGQELVQLIKDEAGETLDGYRGRVIHAEQVPNLQGNVFQHFISVQWSDREGRPSAPRMYSKEQIKHWTRPVLIQEVLADRAKLKREIARQQETHTLKHAWIQQSHGFEL